VNVASAMVAFMAVVMLLLTVRSMKGRCPIPQEH
jgi:hypothetical protein